MTLNNEANIRKICHSGIYNEKSAPFIKTCHSHKQQY